MSTVLLEEILINAISKNLDGLGHIAVGASSPIPGAAALLARTRSNGSMRVSILGSEDNNFLVMVEKKFSILPGREEWTHSFLVELKLMVRQMLTS